MPDPSRRHQSSSVWLILQHTKHIIKCLYVADFLTACTSVRNAVVVNSFWLLAWGCVPREQLLLAGSQGIHHNNKFIIDINATDSRTVEAVAAYLEAKYYIQMHLHYIRWTFVNIVENEKRGLKFLWNPSWEENLCSNYEDLNIWLNLGHKCHQASQRAA